MTIVLHLMPTAVWRELGENDPVSNASLANEGFIHCTDKADVMLQVANEFYSGQAGDFVVLHIDVDSLSSECIWEPPAHVHADAAGGDPADEDIAGEDKRSPDLASLFPHVYGPIDRSAVVGVQTMRREPSGRFSGYGELERRD